MPIYEYHCSKCGNFEAMQKMSDKPLSTCPTCRRKVTKLISSSSFQLKGSGWYITDYARKKGGAAKVDEAPKGESKSTESKSEAKSSDGAAATESKTESKKPATEKASAA